MEWEIGEVRFGGSGGKNGNGGGEPSDGFVGSDLMDKGGLGGVGKGIGVGGGVSPVVTVGAEIKPESKLDSNSSSVIGAILSKSNSSRKSRSLLSTVDLLAIPRFGGAGNANSLVNTGVGTLGARFPKLFSNGAFSVSGGAKYGSSLSKSIASRSIASRNSSIGTSATEMSSL